MSARVRRWERGIQWMAVGGLVAGLGACAPCGSMGAVAVEGADGEPRNLVEQALADFAGWTGRDTICVDRIEIVDDLDSDSELTSLGRYSSARRTIEVMAQQPNLYDTVIHELCHAVDHEDGITRRHGDLFQYDPQAFDYEERSPRSREREAMALACEAGPHALAIAATVGPACRPRADVAFAEVVLDEVYAAMEGRIPPGPILSRRPVASWALPDQWALFGPKPVARNAEGDLLVRVTDGASGAVLALDASSGELLGVASGDQFALPPPPPEPQGQTYLWRRLSIAGWEDGATVSAFTWRLATGDEIRPLVYHDGERWSAPDEPCAPDIGWVVETGEAPWLVSYEDRTLRWESLLRE